MAAGGIHTCVINPSKNGSLVCWGDNSYGQLDVLAGLTGVVAVAARGYHTVALKSDGTVVCFGRNDSDQCNVPTNSSAVAAVSAWLYHTVVMTANGSIVWGQQPPPVECDIECHGARQLAANWGCH